MKQKTFILLFLVPFIGALFFPLNVYYFIVVSTFLITITILRLRKVEGNWGRAIKTFLIGPLKNSWWEIWKNDTE